MFIYKYYSSQIVLTLAGDVQELDIKHEDGAGRDDGPHPLLPVGEVRGDDQRPPLAHTHPAQALVPASDHLRIKS